MLSALGGGDSGSNNSSGQSLEDKLYAVKYFISGQGLSFVVLKATTSELLGPKKKHLNYLVTITNEPNVSIPDLSKYLMRRAGHSEWTVVFKSLITIHHLMSYGNEKFIQNLASSTVNHRSFEYLSSFVDRTTTQAYDMSTFLRRYSRYVNVKIHTYRSLGMDFCKIKPGSKSRLEMRELHPDQLMKVLPILQNQFDTLLAFDASTKDLNNGIISSAFAMLYKDFVKLYISYQAAIIRLLEVYFTINQPKKAQEFLQAYKKFLVRMDKVSDFMRVINMTSLDKSDMPNLSRSPNLSLSALERHLSSLESATLSRRNYQSVSELPKISSDYGTLTKLKRQSSAKSAQTHAGNTLTYLSPNSLIRSAEIQMKRGRSSVATLTNDSVNMKRKESATHDKKINGSNNCDKTGSDYGSNSDKAQESSRYLADLFLADLWDSNKVEEKEGKIEEEDGKDLIIMNDDLVESETTPTTAPTESSSSNNKPTTTIGTQNDWVQVEL